MNDIRLYENIAELAERFPLKLRRYRANRLYLHWHEHIELLHLLAGEGTFVVNGETVTAHAGETVAVNSNSLHTFTADAALDYLCLIVSPAMLAPAGGGSVLLRSVIPEDREVRTRFDAMYKAYQRKDAGASLALLGEAYLLLSHLVTHYAATLTPKAYDVRVAQMKKTTALLDYIHANYASPITAAALAKANAATLLAATDQARLWAMTQALVQAVLSRDAPKEAAPAVRPVITDALTPKGEISLIGENAPPRVIRLLFHWGMDGTPVLRRLSAAVQAAGYSVEEHLCPLVPGRLLHLTIPALATLITTGEQLSAEQSFDFAACLPQGALLRHECALEQGRAGIQLHLHRASAALAQAKQLHDELESFYVPNMDFEKWQTMLDKTLESLKT